MKWIEFIEDRGSFKKGQRVEKDDGAADTLIEAGIAKSATAPETNEASSDSLRALVESVATKAAETAMQTALKEAGTITKRIVEPGEGYELGTAKKFTMPATARRYRALKHFAGPNAEERAYKFGMWCIANYALGSRASMDPEQQERLHYAVLRCKSMDIPLKRGYLDGNDVVTVQKTINNDGTGVITKASNEFTNSSSAFLVPDDFENNIIDLREKFGIFRQNAKIVPMASDTRTDPRRRMGLTAYPVGEGAAGTESTKTWDNVRLTARKWMVLTKISNELNEDAVINVGDDLMGEIAYAFAYTEDVAGFNGTGTLATYGGIQGVTYKLKNLGTIANIMGLQVATGTGYATSYGAIVLGDFNGVVGRLPEFADDNNAKWYCSRLFWGTIMQKLATAAGGNRVMDIENGARTKSFLGYPVVISQALPKTPAVSQVVCLFGDLEKAASLGTRRGVTVSMSDVALNSFEQDQLAIRGTERFDINVHDVGELSTDTGRDTIQGPLAGPVVGLITASS